MLRIIQNTSAAGAKRYYTSASMADYYAEGQELSGIWRGKGAARLGLSGTVGKEAWDALCDNRHPITGKSLTARQKKLRRIGWDFNWHVPKSVSLLYGLTGDQRILEAFRDSVNGTMEEIESEIKTRLRKSGKDEDRVTGNAVWGEFIHQTARPMNGIPDPHLHAHTFLFNATFDDAEGRFKAAQIADIKRDGSFWEAKFHSRMAMRLGELGLPVIRTKKGWEIEGVPISAIGKFSRRTALIEELAAKKRITDPREKSELGAKTRERKQKDLTMDELRSLWRERLSDDERSGVAKSAERLGSNPIPETTRAAEHAAKLAVEHCFQLESVVPERQVLTEALKRAYGHASVESVMRAVAAQQLIVGEREGRRIATTKTVLSEEKAMIDFAREGRGQCDPLLNRPHVFKREWLNDDQRRAAEHVLFSRDRVMVIRGVAGTGKTSMMKEAAEAIEAAGTKVFTFAQSADASRGVLRTEGFQNAETIAMLLKDERLQQSAAGQVWWIDEAGLIGTRTMAQIFDLAEQWDARIVLQGDRKQNAPVERGAALRLLETDAGLIPAELKSIQRQHGAYRDAVELLSEGKTEEGFQLLHKLGWIKQVGEADRYKMLARDYVATLAEGKTALIVSPTHREMEHIEDSVRDELRRAGTLSRQQRRFTVLQNANLTVAQRRDSVNILPGDVIEFHQNAKGHRKGERIVVGEAVVPLDQAERFTAYHTNSLAVSPGDLLRITKNGQTREGNRLNNGTIVKVQGFTKDGNLRLCNGSTIDKSWGHFSYGYCSTAYAAQGQSVKVALVGQSSESFPASSREQFYVSVSRAKERVVVYTDDKAALLAAVRQSDDRMSATELVSERNHRERAVTIHRMNQHAQERSNVTPRERGREAAYER